MCKVCKTTEPVGISPSDSKKVDNLIKLGKYDKVIVGLTNEGEQQELIIDVYDVIRAFNITDPALAHGVKKALCPGQRGSKPISQDIDEAIQSLEKAKKYL